MKKAIAILLTVILLLSGCAGKKDAEAKTEEKATGAGPFSIYEVTQREDGGEKELTISVLQTKATQANEIIMRDQFLAATDEAFTEPVELQLNGELCKAVDEASLQYIYVFTARVPLSAKELWLRTPECVRGELRYTLFTEYEVSFNTDSGEFVVLNFKADSAEKLPYGGMLVLGQNCYKCIGGNTDEKTLSAELQFRIPEQVGERTRDFFFETHQAVFWASYRENIPAGTMYVAI